MIVEESIAAFREYENDPTMFELTQSRSNASFAKVAQASSGDIAKDRT
jgi:hypothetical protein